jgi:SsrA-binding protein
MITKKILATNREVRADYEILETFEAGIKLTGAEVKSAKLGQAKLKGSYAIIGASTFGISYSTL